MKYVWDEKKNAANIRKHGFDFRDAVAIFETAVVIREDRRKDYGEKRFVAIGAISGIVFTVVFTDRNEGERRIISVRRANRKERKVFAKSAGVEDRLGKIAPDDGSRD